MSAEANKKLLQEAFAEIEGGKGTLFAAMLAENVVMRVTGQYTWARPSRERTSAGLAREALLAYAVPRGASRFRPAQLKRWGANVTGVWD